MNHNQTPIDFRAYYYLLRERLWLILFCCLMGALGTATYLIRAERVYAAKAVLHVEQEGQNILGINPVRTEDWQSVEALKTVEHTLKNRAILERVLNTNQLASYPGFYSSDGEPPPGQEELLKRLQEMVTVKYRRGTRLIDITVEHPDPHLAQLLANSLIQEYQRRNFERRISASHMATEFLEIEAGLLKTKLAASENALQAYREKTQSASPETRQSVVLQRLKDLSVKVTETKSQRIKLEATWDQVQALGQNTEALQHLPLIAELPALVEIRSQIVRQESEIANFKQRYRAKHPKYIQAHSQLAEWKKALHEVVLNVAQTLKSSLDSTRAAEAALEQTLRDQESEALNLSKAAIQYNVLLRDVESDRSLYDAVLNGIKETSVTQGIQPSKVQILQSATLPITPVKPDKIKVSVLGMALGLGSGLALVLLLSSVDQSLKTVDQAEEQIGLPVLSVVHKHEGDPKALGRLITANEIHSSNEESFRTLRMALSMLGHKEDRRTFLFTSGYRDEGKTFCSINYGLSLAQQGLRTLVIDCDQRRPTVEKILCDSNERRCGLTDLITGQKNFDEVIYETGQENFYFLPAGTAVPNPAELLANACIDSLMDDALARFDRVIIDTAPIHAVSDTLLIANKVHTVCMVAHAHKTSVKAIRRAVQLLGSVEAPIAGLILNMMPRIGGGHDYYYGTYGNYGAYGESDRGKNGKAKNGVAKTGKNGSRIVAPAAIIPLSPRPRRDGSQDTESDEPKDPPPLAGSPTTQYGSAKCRP